MDSTHERLHRERGKVIDAFVAAEALIQDAKGAKVNTGPLDVQIAERLAIRLMCKHFGWVHCDADTLRRVR